MNPEDPESAQRIVAEYASLLERDLEGGEWPASVDALPYPKQTIKAAIRTSVSVLSANGHLTNELREFLETAYVSLADYVSADLARLMHEYQQAGAALAADRRTTREKTAGETWHKVADASALAGSIARTITEDAEQLRSEFQTLLV